MKKQLFISITMLAFCIVACKKRNDSPDNKNLSDPIAVTQSGGPYGKISKWKSVGGDTIYAQALTLTYFYTEKSSPCNICYYQQNYPLWTDYDYTHAISECSIVSDTLIMKDIDTGRKAFFKREK